MTDATLDLHASCVALDTGALLILGASGRGKSALALQMMALGARLVADDRVKVWRDGQDLMAEAPAALSGLIEARGVGLLRADPMPRARIILAVDLDREEDRRLPPRRSVTLCGIAVDLVSGARHGHFAAALLQYLCAGRAH